VTKYMLLLLPDHLQYSMQVRRESGVRGISYTGPCDHRFGVMHHKLSGLSTHELNGHRKADEHPAYAPEGHGMLYLTLPYLTCNVWGPVSPKNKIINNNVTRMHYFKRKVQKFSPQMGPTRMFPQIPMLLSMGPIPCHCI